LGGRSLLGKSPAVQSAGLVFFVFATGARYYILLSLYARWLDRWETRLATADRNRVVRPLEWGLDWLGIAQNGCPAADLSRFVDEAVSGSDEFFSYRPVVDYHLDGRFLRFTSPIASPHRENNTAHAAYFPASRTGGRAVLIIPQWNADERSHWGLCGLLNRFGISALRLSLAYHDRRKPPETERADYHVSSNLGRTIQATRQSVVDARCCLDWLYKRGYTRIGISGTSLGSCVTFLAVAHDERIRTAVFNHVSMYFSDVVWTGISCRHIQETIHREMTEEDLRRYWSVISPATYLDRLRGRDIMSLLVWGRYDTTFLPRYSRQVVETFRQRGYRHEEVALPCGHYTLGRFPFNWWDGLTICRFLRRWL
jgi:hypothetical protein